MSVSILTTVEEGMDVYELEVKISTAYMYSQKRYHGQSRSPLNAVKSSDYHSIDVWIPVRSKPHFASQQSG